MIVICPHCLLPLFHPGTLSGWGPDPEGVRNAGGAVDPQGGRGRHPEPQQGAAEGAQRWLDPGEEPEERAVELAGSDTK